MKSATGSRTLVALVALIAASTAGASESGLGRPLITGSGQATALAASGYRIAAAAACDVRVLDIGSKPRLLKRFGYCREDRFDSAAIGLWLGQHTIVEEIIISPSPHGETYQLWAGPPGGTLREVGSEWGWTDSDEPPTYGCDRMIAAGGRVVAITPVANNLGDGTACNGHTSTPVTLRGGVNRKLTLQGSWGALATNGKRVVLVEFDASGGRTGKLAMIGLAGSRLGVPQFGAKDVQSASQAWLTPVGLVLDSARGLVGPEGRLLLKRYSLVTVGEGRIVYALRRQLRVRRLKGGPDRLIMKLPTREVAIAAGSFGVALMTGTVGERLAVYRVPWRTIDRVLPR
jgi:hypothetical protein